MYNIASVQEWFKNLPKDLKGRKRWLLVEGNRCTQEVLKRSYHLNGFCSMESINIWKAELWGKDLTGLGREMMCISNIDLWWPLKMMWSVFRRAVWNRRRVIKKKSHTHTKNHHSRSWSKGFKVHGSNSLNFDFMITSVYKS